MNKKVSPEKRDEKATLMIEKASALFLRNGVEPVKMTDIALECGLGVATLYRYFKTKKKILIAVGELLWKKEAEGFEEIERKNIEDNKDGITSVGLLLNHFIDVYKNNPAFFSFLRQFDSFCVQEKVKKEELVSYEKTILTIHDLFLASGKRGIEDKTIRSDINFSLVYFSFSKALIGLSQKLIDENDILESDKEISPVDEISSLINVLLSYFKAA